MLASCRLALRGVKCRSRDVRRCERDGDKNAGETTGAGVNWTHPRAAFQPRPSFFAAREPPGGPRRGPSLRLKESALSCACALKADPSGSDS